MQKAIKYGSAFAIMVKIYFACPIRGDRSSNGIYEKAVAILKNYGEVCRTFSWQQARALLAYHGDEALRARIEELACKSTEEALTEEERAEYEGYVQANKFIATLQAKAKKLLSDG